MIINKKTHLPSISSRGKRLRKNPFFGFFVLLILFVGSPLSVFGNTEDIDSKEMIIQLTLSGVITDDTGSPLPGASIAEKGTANGVISDFDGTFSIAVADSNAVIVITYLGFDSVEVNAADFSDNMTISLSESSSALDEIVITGYGRQVKRNITGAVSAISLKQIENLPLATFENAIQ